MSEAPLSSDQQDIQTAARKSFMSLWQGYCDLKQLARDLMALVEGKCPECGHDDMHSAQVDGKEGISCCNCAWARSYESIRSQVP